MILIVEFVCSWCEEGLLIVDVVCEGVICCFCVVMMIVVLFIIGIMLMMFVIGVGV